MKLPKITLTQEALSRFNETIEKEWLITNGLGGYSSSTVYGINTRKYHGLLVAALNPPGDRTVCLSKLDEEIFVGNNNFQLGANEFLDTIFPQGYRFIKKFSIDPFPIYTYDLSKVKINKTVVLPKGKNAVSVIYQITNKNNFQTKFRVYPLLTCRHFHSIMNRWSDPLEFTQKSYKKELEIFFKRPKEAKVTCRTTDGEFKERINWIERMYYREEASRGESNTDDCFQPGYFEIEITGQGKKLFAITTMVHHEPDDPDNFGNSLKDIREVHNRALRNYKDLLVNFYTLHKKIPMTDWLNWILLATDSFIVKESNNKKGVIAGYYWFEPWGRDTFISLPGLMLVTGRFNDAKDVLENFIQYCNGGLIPNFISDKSGEPVYNTVDGTLWYINAVLQYLKYTGDFTFIKETLWDNLQTIIENYEKGTLFGIHLDDDGLVKHGSRLTWMDAVVEQDEITPRAGKAVEIQALWYNSLRIMELLAYKFGESALAEKYASMANKTSKSFNEKFWIPQLSCLYDVLEEKGVDPSLRPNQIFAVSLDFTMLNMEKNKMIVDTVGRELATPYGLRTLALRDPKFMGKCFGDRRSRDTAYHNGTIWPWLLGPFITAFLKVNASTDTARQFAFKNYILPLFSVTIHQGGLGTISEIFDCDPPNSPRGCIAQAWSVAEPLRAYVEDVLGVKPKYAIKF